MSENLMKENRGCAAGKQCGAGVGIHERRFVERFGFLDHRLNVLEHGLVVGSVFRSEPVEIVVAVDVHPVGSFALNVEFEAVVNLAEGNLGSFAGHFVLIGG